MVALKNRYVLDVTFSVAMETSLSSGVQKVTQTFCIVTKLQHICSHKVKRYHSVKQLDVAQY